MTRTILSAITAASLVLLATSAPAASTIYTDPASFLAGVGAYYHEDFSGLPDGDNDAPLNFSQGGFSYVMNSIGLGNDEFWVQNNRIQSMLDTQSILITFTSGNVFAVGGHMWAGDVSANPIASQLEITLSDGTVTALTSASTADFRGFISPVPLTSIQLTAPGVGRYATLDHLYVAVPEPGSLALLAVASLTMLRRRRA
jgi:hypothetical protein